MHRYLNGKLKLGDIEDVEWFCQVQLKSYLKNKKFTISSYEFEELVGYLLALTWELFDSKWNGDGTFSGYASYIMPKRIVDYFRNLWGRKGEKLPFVNSYPLSDLERVRTGRSERATPFKEHVYA